MKRAVWASLYYKLSKLEKLKHGLCPGGNGSWCKFKKSAISGFAYEQKDSLPDAVQPVFKDLASVDLLK